MPTENPKETFTERINAFREWNSALSEHKTRLEAMKISFAPLVAQYGAIDPIIQKLNPAGEDILAHPEIAEPSLTEHELKILRGFSSAVQTQVTSLSDLQQDLLSLVDLLPLSPNDYGVANNVFDQFLDESDRQVTTDGSQFSADTSNREIVEKAYGKLETAEPYFYTDQTDQQYNYEKITAPSGEVSYRVITEDQQQIEKKSIEEVYDHYGVQPKDPTAPHQLFTQRGLGVSRGHQAWTSAVEKFVKEAPDTPVFKTIKLIIDIIALIQNLALFAQPLHDALTKKGLSLTDFADVGTIGTRTKLVEIAVSEIHEHLGELIDESEIIRLSEKITTINKILKNLTTTKKELIEQLTQPKKSSNFFTTPQSTDPIIAHIKFLDALRIDYQNKINDTKKQLNDLRHPEEKPSPKPTR